MEGGLKRVAETAGTDGRRVGTGQQKQLGQMGRAATGPAACHPAQHSLSLQSKCRTRWPKNQVQHPRGPLQQMCCQLQSTSVQAPPPSPMPTCWMWEGNLDSAWQ